MKTKFKNYKSVKNFKKNLKSSAEVINGLILRTYIYTQFTKKYVLSRKFSQEERENKNYKIVKKSIRTRNHDEDKVYELGFIKLYADFEFFLYELIKELLTKYPTAIPNKELSFSEISRYDDINELKSAIIDSLSVIKSYDLKSTINYLDKTFGIKLLKNEEEYDWLYYFNVIRNSILHSNGKINQKIIDDLKLINHIKSIKDAKLKIGDDLFSKEGKFLFEGTLRMFYIILENINSSSIKKDLVVAQLRK